MARPYFDVPAATVFTQIGDGVVHSSREGLKHEIRFEPEVVRWYWSTAEVEVEEPDHACGPDCPLCWAVKDAQEHFVGAR